VPIWTGSGTLAAIKFTAADLVATLTASPEESYVRVVADWLAHGEVTAAGPALTGRAVVDPLVAAGYRDRFFAYSLAHAPAEFAARGLLVEQDSLVSV
jgi:hypothetical protein